MKRLVLAAAVITLFWANLLFADEIEIEIHGMTCAFCADRQHLQWVCVLLSPCQSKGMTG